MNLRLGLVAALSVIAIPALAGPMPGWGHVNVTDPPYLAVGDGIADDGPAIQKALDDVGQAGGGRVFLPAAVYKVRGHLRIPSNTTLAGTFTGPPKSVRDLWPAPNLFVPPAVGGAMLLAFEGENDPSAPPFITMAGHNTTLEGLSIYYPAQTFVPKPFPWTIALAPWPTSGPQTFGSENVTIQNIVLVNSYNGIDLASYPSSRHMVRGVYGQPLRTGIQVDQSWDIGRISDVHFNQLWTSSEATTDYQLKNAFAFVFFRTDGEQVHDVFVWGYHVGMLFAKSPLIDPRNAGCNNIDCSPDVQLTNISFDATDVGLDIYDTKVNGVTVTNYAYANQGRGDGRIGIVSHAGTRGYASVVNGKFWGPMQAAVVWEGNGSLSLSQSHIIQWGLRIKGNWDNTMAAVDVRSGRAMIQGNLFFPQYPNGQAAAMRAVSVSSPEDVMVTANMLNGNKIVLWPAAQSTLLGLNKQ